jgi:hypothetical protein
MRFWKDVIFEGHALRERWWWSGKCRVGGEGDGDRRNVMGWNIELEKANFLTQYFMC